MTRSRLTLEKIAKVAGVSRSTVSRVINNEPNVRDEVRQRVLSVVEQMGYYPNAAARSLASDHSHILGVVIAQTFNTVFSDPFFPNVLRGLAAEARDKAYHLMFSMIAPELEDDFYLRTVRSHMLDGLVLVSALENDPLLLRLKNQSIPVVSIGRQPSLPDVNSVDADNVNGALVATRHLIELGRRRVSTIAGPSSVTAALDRLEGYRTALRQVDIPSSGDLVAEGDFTESGGYAAMKRLLRFEPDAVFVASDLMAIGALRAIREGGKRVPDDIALVGFDDAPIATVAEPALTTVRQPVYDLGVTAVKLLLRLLEGTEEGPQRIVLPTELIVRASCGASKRY